MKQGVNIAPTVHDVKYEYVLPLFHTIDDQVIAHWKAPQARAEIITAAANVRVACEKKKRGGKRIDKTIGDLKASTLPGDVIPDIIEFSFRFRCKPVLSH